MSAKTTVSPLVVGPRDWMTEVQAILADKDDAPAVQREHLLALAGAMAETTKQAALMNRALVAIMVDNKLPVLNFPPGLIEMVEANALDLTIEKKGMAIIVTLIKPTPKHQVN